MLLKILSLVAAVILSTSVGLSAEQTETVRRDDCLEALAASVAPRDPVMKWYVRERTRDKILVLVRWHDGSVVLWKSSVPRDLAGSWVGSHPLANPRTCPDDIPLEPTHVGSESCPRLLEVAKAFEELSVPALVSGVQVHAFPATVRFEMWNGFVTWVELDASDDPRMLPLFKALGELDKVEWSCLAPESKH